MLKKVNFLISFLLFEWQVQFQNIYKTLCRVQNRRQLMHEKWPISATRRELILIFWQSSFLHYGTILLLSALIVLVAYKSWDYQFAISFLLVCLSLYVPLYFIFYRQLYLGLFLPRLDHAIACLEDNEKSWMDKCRQSQVSTRALVLLFYVFEKSANINYLTASDKSANLLLRVFGVSQKGLKNELDLIFKRDKRQNLGERKQTEIAKSFEEVYTILEEMQFSKGVQMLKDLEIRFNRPE